MKYLLVASLFLMVGCQNKEKVEYTCMTPFGVLRVFSDDPKLTGHNSSYLTLEDDSETLYVPRVQCVDEVPK